MPEKPPILYHGSRTYHTQLTPGQAIGFSGEADNECGVYAVARRDLAVAFALSYIPKSDQALFSIDTDSCPPKVKLLNTTVDWSAQGYLYALSSDTFEQISLDQWLSRQPVTPVEITEIDPTQYRDWVEYVDTL